MTHMYIMGLCIKCNINKPRAKQLCQKCYDSQRFGNKRNVKQYCQCGCGQLIPITGTRGKLIKFAPYHNVKGENHPRWKGGRMITSDGYISIWDPNHPFCNRKKRVPEHRKVLEEIYSKLFGVIIYINPKEFAVHHIDNNRLNNDPLNLELIRHTDHASVTYRKDMSDRFCSICKSNDTRIDKKGYKHWYKHPITKEKWVCNNCYQNIRNRYLA